ncbi:MAG: DUF4493 domain-containing protein [Muribaculaceae bacterium]|nr:DUF4493 domain-containing protein [Muribaculaceae bacterium]
MKKIQILALSLIATIGAFTSCSDDTIKVDAGEGKINLDVTLDNDVKVESRADGSDISALMEDFQLYIYSSKGLIRKYHKVSEIPTKGLWLITGSYQAVVWAGDSTDASYTHKYFMGKTNFEVTKGGNTVVSVVGKIQNTVASVVLPDALKDLMPDLKMTIGTSAGTLDFEYSNYESAKGYYMIPKGETDLKWKITGTQEDGSAYVKEGTVKNAKGATEYQFKIIYDPNQSTGGTGGASLSVSVDASEVPVGESITVTSAPKIVGSGFDISQPYYSGQQKFDTKLSVYVTASAEITSIVLSCDNVAGWEAATGISGSSVFDFYKANANVLAQLKNAGVYRPASSDAEGQGCGYNAETKEDIQKIVLSKALLNKLANGSYNITITATDANGKTRTAVLDIEISEDKVVSGEAQEAYHTSATLTATIADATASNFGFEYRDITSRATEGWQWIDGVVSEDGLSFTAKLTGLTAGAKYEWRAACTAADGSYSVSNITNTFTTQPTLQFKNNSFEDWVKNGNVWMPSSSTGDFFWDSGNWGSTTLGAEYNITTQDTSIKHSGNSSIKMASRYIILKFAAGNVFIGDYLATEGTDGVLGLGREFAARPKALHGWVKYRPVAMEKGSNWGDKNPYGAKKGDMDHGMIYVALSDGTTSSYNGQNFPFIIKTKNQAQLFDKNAKNIIGYGEIMFTENTAGEDMVEFTIPIEYRSDAMPKYISLVASASYLGDYFVGGDGSTMWLDDLELVYE